MKSWMIILCVLLTVVVAQGVRVVLTPSADSYVRIEFIDDGGDYWSWYDDENYGGEPHLDIESDEIDYYPEHWRQWIRYTFVNFDLSGLGGAEEVTYVALRLYCSSFTSDGEPIYVKEVLGPWEEYTITYNNRPPVGELLGSMPAGDLTPGIYNNFELDVSHFHYMLNNPELFYGLRVSFRYTNEDLDFAVFHSRENTYKPELVIDYTPSAVEETSWGEIKAQDW